MTIQTGDRRIHIGWRFILHWPSAFRAATARYTHATVYIGSYRVMRW